MQKYCEKCGNELYDNADVCVKCGRLINKNKVKNSEKVFLIFRSIILPLFIVLILPPLLFIMLIFKIWFYQDLVNEFRCRKEFGSEYKLERTKNIDAGLCCINGEFGSNCKSLYDISNYEKYVKMYKIRNELVIMQF